MVDCKQCLKSSYIVHFLVLMFGAGAWIAVNGVWVELPVIVSETPEYWSLPSYLTVLAQIANVGPILVTLMQALCPKYFHQNAMIYSILLIGTASCILLSFFWNTVAVVGGEKHSVALFALWFALAFVDCTSSVTFLPFMSTFQTIFITTYFIGEGLSGLLPSIFALAQGVGSTECRNVSYINSTTNMTEYHIKTVNLDPRFSPDVFFGLLCVMMVACSVSFILLNHLGVAQKFYATSSPAPYSRGSRRSSDGTGFYNSVEMSNSRDGSQNNNSTGEEQTIESTGALLKEAAARQLTRGDYVYLLIIIFFINAVANGVLPSVLSYSSLPYGEVVYHLSASLGNMANPVACFIAIFLPMHSFIGLALCTLLSAGFGSYLMLLAVQSPCPVLVNETSGSALMVLAQILFVGFVSYIKVSIAQIFRSRGHKRSLVWYGAVVQAGSLVGAMTMFPLVNVYYLFTSGDSCATVCP